MPHQKQKNIVKIKSSRRTKRSVKKVVLAHQKTAPLRHFRLVNHAHSGRLIHHRHTSHLALMMILIIIGVFLYASQSLAQAQQVNRGQSLTVGGVVTGPPPTTGATIVQPVDQATVTDNPFMTSGICEPSTLVVIYDNGQPAGSTTCTTAGIFVLQVQLLDGSNALQALNYDGLNQAGPVTPTVTITGQLVTISSSGVVESPQPVIARPQPPLQLVNPMIIPTLPTATKKTCTSYNGPPPRTTGPLTVTVICMIRGLQPTMTYQLGLLIQGGTPSYAVNISWGTSQATDTLTSIDSAGYSTIDFAYPIPGQFAVKIHAKDKVGNSSFTQTVAAVNGTTASSILTILKNQVIGVSWFESPVPLYLIAVTLTLGFWIGDLFDRRYGIHRVRSRTRRKRSV